MSRRRSQKRREECGPQGQLHLARRRLHPRPCLARSGVQRGTKKTPSGRLLSPDATCKARRVLPVPAVPVSVISLHPACSNCSLISTTSRSRPMNAVVWAGRLPTPGRGHHFLPYGRKVATLGLRGDLASPGGHGASGRQGPSGKLLGLTCQVASGGAGMHSKVMTQHMLALPVHTQRTRAVPISQV